ncbi:MAG: HlyD family efflux transporter periplasmic adaptor subunit [Clostridia bacterium]|nr:HlyD family efflux transporter periplasmic adaptor subunit [Clostridia bacterium]
MKKYIWLAGATVALSLAFLLVGPLVRESVPQVTVQEIEMAYIEQTVFCTGRVEEAGREVQAVSTGNTRVQVRVAVPENRLRQVAEGQAVRVTGAAFRREVYTGTVVSLGKEAYLSQTGGTVVDAVIALDVTDASLRCGLTAKADICVSNTEGILLPYTAVCADETGQEYVYVVENARAVRRDITVAEELAEGVLIRAGVAAGERLITQPEKVTGDGDPVEVAG